MVHTTRVARLVRALTGAAAVLTAACESPSAPHHTGVADVPVRITAVTVGTPISTLVVEVSAADLPATLVYNLAVANGVASGTIKMPPGAARTIHVTAFDGQGNMTHEGTTTVDVRPGQNPPVQIKLTPKSGQVPISVTFGNFGVVVTPPQAALDLAGNPTVQLAVTVTDVNGQVIPSPQVGWATSQPAVATVSASGLVTGLIDGSATIVATYEGVAGLSAITVSTGVSAEICDGIDNDHNGTIDDPPFCRVANGTWSLSPSLTTTCAGSLVNQDPFLAKPTINGVTTRITQSQQLSLQFDFSFQTWEVQVPFDPWSGVFGGSFTASSGQITGTATISGTFIGSGAFTGSVKLIGIKLSANGFDATCVDVDQSVTATRIAN